MRILQGVTGQAGQPLAISRGLRRLGFEADAVHIHDHKFGYPADINVAVNSGDLLETYAALKPLIDKYDVFHFHARGFLLSWPEFEYPSGLDLVLLKMHGKKIFFHFRGGEIRYESEFRANNPWHTADDPETSRRFSKAPDRSKKVLSEFISSIADGIFAVDHEIQSYVPNSIIVPRALDEEQWPFVGVSDSDLPLIVHAPSRPFIKGTPFLLEAIEQLRSEGLEFRFELIEKRPHHEAAQIYRQADIIVDQLRTGWHGVLSVESMALGKPTVAYIRDDLLQKVGSDFPIVSATPATIADTLRTLITNRDLRKQISLKSREYFLATHSSTAVARQLADIYAAAPPNADYTGVANFLRRQNQQAVRQLLQPLQETSPTSGSIDPLQDFDAQTELTEYFRSAKKLKRDNILLKAEVVALRRATFGLADSLLFLRRNLGRVKRVLSRQR